MTKKNRNVTRLLKEMKKLAIDVNDNEICKKFETLIKSGTEEDIVQVIVSRIIDDPFDVDDKEIPEIYVMYFRHYRFMRKRQKKIQEQQAQNGVPAASPKSTRRTTRKSSTKRPGSAQTKRTQTPKRATRSSRKKST